MLRILILWALCWADFSPATVVSDMLAENNRLRAERGLPPQELDERLCKAAQEQADYLARTGQFDHHVNGNPRTRAAKYGFPVVDAASLEVRENLAGDFQSVQNAFRGWQGSSGHYANIVSNCDRCGFGVAQGRSGRVWCAVYGREGKWRVEKTWPGHPFVRWRWYDGENQTKWTIETSPNRQPPPPFMLPKGPDHFFPGVSPLNL